MTTRSTRRTISVDVATATPEQLLIHLLDAVTKLDTRLDKMEKTMVDLASDVTALKAAVDGVAQRLLPKVDALEAALAAAQADDAVAADVLAQATAASADIRAEVDRLNALGADPTTPVDPAAPDAGNVPDVPATPDVPADAPADVPADAPADPAV